MMVFSRAAIALLFPPHSPAAVDFEKDVAPILTQACAECHNQAEEDPHVMAGSRYSQPHADSKLCEDCHTAAGSRTGEATVDVKTDFNTKQKST